MAKRSSKSKSGGKNVLRGIAIFLGVIIVLGAAGVLSSWITGWALTGEPDITKWQQSSTAEKEEAKTVAISNDGSKMLDGEAYTMPSGFAFLSTRSATKPNEYAAGGEVTISASTSNEFINGKYDWSLKFNNPNSEWAKGKTPDFFIDLDPTEDGRQCKVKYLAKFSEQIILTATLQGSESSDSCTIDCVRDLETGDYNWGLGHECDFNESLYIVQHLNWGEGTIYGDLDLISLEVNLTEDWKDCFRNFLNFSVTFKTCDLAKVEGTYLDKDYLAQTGDARVVINGGDWTYSNFIEGFDDYDKDHKDAIYYAWYKAWQEEQTNINWDSSYSCTYAGATVKTVSKSGYGEITGAACGKDVTPSVTLNKNVTF